MRKVDGVGVMKDKEAKFDEMETSHTLDEGRVQGRVKWRGCIWYSVPMTSTYVETSVFIIRVEDSY